MLHILSAIYICLQHYFLKQIPNASTTLDTRKLFKELAAYRNALPVEYGSSCFCRVINSRLDLLRVMITGPDGSPYANGCFFFDINLPASYPQVAPKVQFLTTGGGKIRFNPNLYNCGKVCLSLLGTWSGPGWISGESTMLQVLISIQSLILVPDPYFNEPGWEASRGTLRGEAASKQYNGNIRRCTIDVAIKSHLTDILNKKSPYPEFEAVMIKHFLEKRSLIEVELKSWAKQDSSLLVQVQSVLDLFARLASRGKTTRRKSSRPKQPPKFASIGGKSTEPIELDDSDVEEVTNPLAVVGKSETIEIDLSDSEDDCKVAAKVTAKSGAGDVVDLT
jgi:ubiquitin-protein ligase